MQKFWKAFVVVAALASVITTAHADDIGTAKSQLASLSAAIGQVDIEIAAIEQKNAELQGAIKSFADQLDDNKRIGDQVKETNTQLIAEKDRLAAEQHSSTELCDKQVSQREYKTVLAECETAQSTYRQHFNSFQQAHEKASEEYQKYIAETKYLESDQKDLEKKRQDIVQTQSTLNGKRENLVKQYDETREHLIALQTKRN